MKWWRSVVEGLILASCAVSILPAFAQQFPNRPIRIVTGEAGGANDIVSRIVGQGISPALGQPVIIENRGGSAAILARIVLKSTPDGHSLLVTTGSFWVAPLLQTDDVGYDPVRDFAPVALLTRTPIVLVVHPSITFKSVSELVAAAKAKPGALNLASGPPGSSPHLGAALFNFMAGVDIPLIPYKGGGPAMVDLVAGRVHLYFGTGALIGPHLKSGKLRALAVGSAEPSTMYPGLPTIAASGVPGYESVVTQTLFAPARTPPSTIDRINQEITAAIARPEVRDRFTSMETETARASPAQAGAHMKAEIARMSKLIKETGMRAGP